MTTLARYQAFALDAAGNVLASPTVEVRDEGTGALVGLFSDRAGTTGIGNPFTGASDGLVAFHVAGGAYKITVTSGSIVRTFRYVAIGTAAEQDIPLTPPLQTAWTNARIAKTANYSVANSDKGKTFALGGNSYFTLTFNAASGYDADFLAVIINEDAGRAKLIAPNGVSSFRLWPGQTATIYNQNNTWVVSRPNRWKLPGNVTIFVDPSSGTDSATAVDGMASGAAAYAGADFAYSQVQVEWDLDGKTVTCSLPAGTITRTTAWSPQGPLVGQTAPNQFDIHGQGVSSTTLSTTTNGAYFVECFNGARVQVSNAQLLNTGTGGGGLLCAEGVIWFKDIWFDIRSNTALDVAGPGSQIAYMGGNWTILGGHTVNIFAVAEDHGIIYLGGSPGVTISGSPIWATAFVQADLGGMIEATGFVIALAGSPQGPRYSISSMGIVFTGGSGGANFFPGNAAGVGSSSSAGFYL